MVSYNTKVTLLSKSPKVMNYTLIIVPILYLGDSAVTFEMAPLYFALSSEVSHARKLVQHY
jgi:hypothetical protein